MARASHAEANKLASLRTGGTSRADCLVVSYHAQRPVIELGPRGRPLLSGAWEIQIAVDGRPIPIPGDWECACWHSDRDADYLELQCTVECVLRIDRQILLPRTGGLALLADAVVADSGQRVDYTARLPLAPRVRLQPGRQSRECRLRGPQVSARLFPLALPQDRVQSTAGSFAPQPTRTDPATGNGSASVGCVQRSADAPISALRNTGCLELRQSGPGRALYAPLVIDWNPDRRRAAAEWRTLTVSEDGNALRPEQAAGHRLRLGTDQWLVYRSLINSPEPRAVLGHQTRYETVVGRFDRTGEVSSILSII